MDKINFENLPSTSTPISAENLNQVQANIEKALIGTILYEDETGTTGDVSLSNNIINYSSFKVYGYYIHQGNTTIKTKFSKEFEVNSISDIIDFSGVVYSGESYTYFITENASVTGSTITRGSKWKSAFGVKEDSGSWREKGEYVYITKVIGYE